MSLSPSSSSSIAVVTGATGYIGAHVVDQLLRKGYAVRGTVRSLSDPKSAALQADFPALALYEADLTRAGSFDKAIDGARFVFHVASVAKFTADDVQKEIIDPAVNGTADVVAAALRTPSVQAIVVTSSIATVLDMAAPAGKVYTDSDWNEHWPLDQAPYMLSKVLAERKAWELVDQHNAAHPERTVKLVTILPGSVIGPPVGSRVDGYSVNILTDLLNGSLLEGGVLNFNFSDVDVRDVAAAHIAAAERATAKGRYLLTRPTPTHGLDYVPLLRPLFPTRTLPTKAAGPWAFKEYRMDNSRSKTDLGIAYIDQRTSVNDMVAKLIEIGLVKPE